MKASPLLLSILAGLAAAGCVVEEEEMCLDVPDDTTTCPAADEVDKDDLFSQNTCDDLTVRKLLGEGVLSTAFGYNYYDTGADDDLICCYPAKVIDPKPGSECAIGRPYLESDTAVVAPLRAGDATWCGAPAEVPADAALAAVWLEMAQMEHASVAAFARLTLELMACGAPPELLAAVQQAALEEVHHARACFGVAARLSGEARSPGAMPFTAPIAPSGDLAALAVSAVQEGCMGETLGAALAAEAAARATDPEIRALLDRIAADEGRHAALSWRIVAWAVRTGGAPVRAAVADAFRLPVPVASAIAADSPAAEALGVLGPAAYAAVCQRTLAEVVRPARAALLAVA